MALLFLVIHVAGKQQTIQCVIDSLQISTLEYRSESDHDVLPYVHERKIEVIEVLIFLFVDFNLTIIVKAAPR